MARRARRLRYGHAPGQFGVLHEPHPSHVGGSVVVLVHGGFWRWPFNRWVMTLLVRDAVRRGHTVLNIEYRRLGRWGGGGGYPQTFDDVSAAVDLVVRRFPNSPRFLVGHSAGGHLALVAAAGRGGEVDGVVALSAPCDLRRLSEGGSERVDELVRHAPMAERWALTSPIEMLPIGVPTVCIHGAADTTVRPQGAARFVRAASDAGDQAHFVLVPDERHRDALRPTSTSWTTAMETIERWLDLDAASRSARSVTMDGS